MPFVLPCPKALRNNADVLKAAERAAYQMAEAGYKHNDLHWRHVGLYKEKGLLKVVFFDLADVKESDSNDFKQVAQEMIDELYKNNIN